MALAQPPNSGNESGGLPATSLPSSIRLVTVDVLEGVALESQRGRVMEFSSKPSWGLSDFPRIWRLDLGEVISGLKRQFPNEVLLAGDLGCQTGTLAAEMNRIKGAAAFGVDKYFELYQGEGGLPLNRCIFADLECMPHIPRDSFHFLISMNTTSFTDLSRSFPEVYRILRPGGVAMLDHQYWFNHVDELKALGMDDVMEAVSLAGYRGPIGGYGRWSEAPGHRPMPTVENSFTRWEVRFEMGKPA